MPIGDRKGATENSAGGHTFLHVRPHCFISHAMQDARHCNVQPKRLFRRQKIRLALRIRGIERERNKRIVDVDFVGLHMTVQVRGIHYAIVATVRIGVCRRGKGRFDSKKTT